MRDLKALEGVARDFTCLKEFVDSLSHKVLLGGKNEQRVDKKEIKNEETQNLVDSIMEKILKIK